MNLHDELIERAAVLQNVQFKDAAGRLVMILVWLESEPVTKGILDALRQKVNIEELFKGTGRSTRPRANTREEIASVGLELIERCRRRQTDFFQICSAVGIQPTYDTNSVQDYSDHGIEAYIEPFLKLVERELVRAAESYSVSTVAEHRFAELLNLEIRNLLPRTSENLGRLSGEFLRPESEVSWQNVGNSCRQALIEFSAEIREVCGIDLPSDIQEGNVKAILKHLLNTIASGRFKDTLESLSESIWNHTQSLVHRSATSKKEAVRLFLWTGMLVSEYVQLIRAYSEA